MKYLLIILINLPQQGVFFSQHQAFQCFKNVEPIRWEILTPIEQDTDGDGVPDKKDACPDEPGLKGNKGCPEGIVPPEKAFRFDRDKDGILNDVDKCPDLAGIEEEEGCPPNPYKALKNLNISSSVQDIKIENPPMPTIFEAQTPPIELSASQPNRDADHDGVKNSEDKCPFTPGTKSKLGCPDLSETEDNILRSIEEDVTFEIIQSKLSENAKASLEALSVMISIPFPNTSVRFSVYADEYGWHQDNVNLSIERGKSIEKYLIEKGIDRSRIRLQYFGDLRTPRTGTWVQSERSKVVAELIFP